MDFVAYLRRINYDGSLEPTPETLRSLHRAHLYNIPFENLDISLKRPITLFRDRLFQKIVVRGRGGFCYELNGLFAELLKSLGFHVTLLSARVTINSSRVPPEFDHLTLLITFQQNQSHERWLADVGFGDSFIDPLPLVSGAEYTQDDYVYQLNEGAPGEWSAKQRKIEGAWQGMYDFTIIPRQLGDFSRMCRFHQTSPDSGFTKGRICSIATPDGRKTLSEKQLVVTQNGLRTESELSEGQYYRVLRDEFGIILE